MSKSALTLHREIAKKEHLKTPVGKLEHELQGYYEEHKYKHLFVDDDEKPTKTLEWVNEHREASRKAQEDIEERYSVEFDALNEKFRKEMDELLISSMQTELEHIKKHIS